MFGAIVVLWLGSEPELAERRADINAWAQQRQLHAEPLRPMAPAYDAALADQVEALLEEARTTPSALVTPNALERAEALLLEHPELPQAAWLLAERYAIEAHALATSADAARRRELGERARALEGARASAVGSAPTPVEPAPDSPPALAPHGPRPHDRVLIDGVAVETNGPEPALLLPGRHHVRLERAALPVWSGWVRLEAGRAAPLTDPTPACGGLDLADVRAGSAAPQAAPGVRCQRWAVARPSLRGGVDLAECRGSRCGPWQTGSLRPEAPQATLLALDPERSAWPGWATWSLVGAGALAATGLVLWQTGAFDRGDPSTEFVFTGPSASAYRF